MKTTLRTTTVLLALLAVLVWAPLASAQKKGTTDKAGKSESPQARQVTFLGVLVEPLHPSLFAHLRDVLEGRQGVLVSQVAEKSPAEKAGLKAHDILMSYGDQKLFSPRQLAALVQADKPGQSVTLHIVRGGKPMEVNVTLGEHARMQQHTVLRPTLRLPGRSSEKDQASGKSDWESFDSMTLRSLGKGRYHVDIGFETKEGKVEHRTFEGTREEIHKDIMAQKDLPDSERAHLLRALDQPNGELQVPRIYFSPDGRIQWDYERVNRGI
jgi:hypothetical protein